MKEKYNKNFNEICFLIGYAFLQTILFLLIVFILERIGIFGIYIKFYNSKYIYPYELGGFFFAFILISDMIIEIVKRLLKIKLQKR